ncbi:type IV pilus secretin PilQ [Tepidicella baoligensis]|uniref:type IV pilus secretin PilQ n=1 Tax=Tepidicella baoligensis TaxID=2707016 RepID=UPI003CCD36C6
MTFKDTTGHHQGRTMSRIGKLSLLASTWLLAGLAQAQLAIESVTAAMQGGSEVIRIQTSEPLQQLPAGFSIQSPARIALDFAGAQNATGRNLVEINQGNLRSVNVVEAGGRTRVVLNLNQSVNYETRLEGNALLVLLKPPTVAAPTGGGTAFAEAVATRVQPLADIDFRRGTDNAGRVIVDLPSSQTGVDIRQQGRNLVVEFTQTSLPEGLRRRMDVTDFGTPVRTITATQVGDRVRLVVEPTGNWEHSAYQSDNQFVLELREIKADPDKLAQGPRYTGEKLSLNFQNIEIRSLLQVIADFTNFNIITSDSVTGSVTLRLKDVPWDQALDIILQSKGLGMRTAGNVIWVAPQAEILAREREELEAKQVIRGLEPVRTQSFRLNFSRAEEVAKQLTTAVGTGDNEVRLLSRQGSVFAEPRTNQLFVTDIAAKLEEIQELIKKLDIPVRQVLIEARIVEAEDTFGKSLGVRFGGRWVGSNASVVSGTNNASTRDADGEVTGTNFINLDPTGRFVNIPVSTTGVGEFAVSLFNASATRLLNLEIAANESDRKLKTVSSPRVVTADQKQAVIEDGRKFPFLRRDADGNTTIEFIDASLKLIVLPQITPDGDVIMELEVKNDSPIIFNGETAIQTKSVQTQVLVTNGGTVVIGGIYVQEDLSNVDKVPLLGDVPVIGNLFRSRQNASRKSELLVFITPRVLSDSTTLSSLR